MDPNKPVKFDTKNLALLSKSITQILISFFKFWSDKIISNPFKIEMTDFVPVRTFGHLISIPLEWYIHWDCIWQGVQYLASNLLWQVTSHSELMCFRWNLPYFYSYRFSGIHKNELRFFGQLLFSYDRVLKFLKNLDNNTTKIGTVIV